MISKCNFNEIKINKFQHRQNSSQIQPLNYRNRDTIDTPDIQQIIVHYTDKCIKYQIVQMHFLLDHGFYRIVANAFRTSN
jgi:hypothetical protein